MHLDEIDWREITNICSLDNDTTPNHGCCLPNFFVSHSSNSSQLSSKASEFDKLVEEVLKNNRSSHGGVENHGNYCGHYIVLIGYDDSRRLVFYRNPSSSNDFSFTSYSSFECARRSFGTDEDLIFIYSSIE